jgi:hypothetical protein
MSKVLVLLKPLLGIALLVGAARFFLSVLHAPRAIVYLASLTVVQLAGTVYLALCIARERELGYTHLWAANLILFGVCQLLILGGLAYTYLTGTPTLYHEAERLRRFLKYEPTPLQHVRMHMANWMIISPTLATWLIGAPIIYFRRRS